MSTKTADGLFSRLAADPLMVAPATVVPTADPIR
ncbi:unnamed protein product, partial [Rotaria magnacalcarata]